jgi:hypothetical protein
MPRIGARRDRDQHVRCCELSTEAPYEIAQ